MTDRPRARDPLQAIPAYQAGRTASEGAFKLSSNENPFPPLPGVVAAVVDAAAHVNRYPDFGSSRLIGALAERHGVSPRQVAVGAGSVEVVNQLVSAYAGAGDEVVIPWRSFEAYPIIVALAGATQVAVPLRRDFTHDLGAMASAITERTRVVMVCTPNNPTGTAVRRRDLLDFLDDVPRHVVVAIDEAYVEFVRDADSPPALDLALERENVVVLRTFSKAYGLAGLRVGYAIGPDDVVGELRKAQLPFGVSTAAQIAATASLAAEPELLRRVQLLVNERERVVGELMEVPLAVPPPQGNFVWLPLGARADEFSRRCGEVGVVVRPFSGEGVRVTIGEREANVRWLAVLRDFLGL